MNLYSRGDEVGGRTLDVVWSWRSWLFGVEVSRWKLLTGGDPERTITVHIGPLHITTWKLRTTLGPDDV